MIRSFDGKTPRIAASAFISETAYIIGDVEIGENSGVFPGAVIRGDFGKIIIGNHTMIEDNTVVHAGFDPLEIGDHCTVGHSVVLHCIKVGNNCLIGNNATILDNTKIGNFCVVAAGALVEQGKNIPDGSMVTGVPGVIKGKVSEARMEKLKRGNPWYTELVKKYKSRPELNNRE
jgi:carbonic anhydrase/acetyltransferase-like protein (isoleucine patch superfamily)